MKLVIDIDEEVKKTFDDTDDINFSYYDYNSVIGKAIKTATPLEKVLGDIRAEIIHLMCKQYNRRPTLDREKVLEIIDKRISGKE